MNELKLVEILANKGEPIVNIVKEHALLRLEDPNHIFAIISYDAVKDLSNHILLMKPLPKDIKALSSILSKYGIKRLYLAIEVDNRKTAGKVIGKKGWKMKMLSKYIGMPLKVVVDGSGGDDQ
ncbi:MULTISPECIES: hypothetical protein [unclassified Archaeoglobus]|jgi:hypothetical protein|uniref:hypothetical protein n=1 Tax=unclassified Archaeoglobus TaxID=2643606 RepID=UPI0025C176F0|nr:MULTISPECIES: hypothetical protein [unclassified Archaeoglobus]